MKLFIILLILIGGLIAPSSFSNADKNFTKLDRLASYVYLHSNNNDVDCYHIASAILSAGGPVKTLTAIAEVESSFNPKAVGDQGRSIGMLQVQERYHGKVPTDVYGQVKQAQDVLRKVKTIRKYNGKGYMASQYVKRVKMARRRLNAIYTI